MSDQDWSTHRKIWEKEYGCCSIEQLAPGELYDGYVGLERIGSFRSLKAAQKAVDRAYMKHKADRWRGDP